MEFRQEVKEVSSRGQAAKEHHDADITTIIPLKDVAKEAAVKAEREMILRALHERTGTRKRRLIFYK
jgi:hypothetical protein